MENTRVENRKSILIGTCITNIVVTMILALVKVVFGIISGSLAMITDAISYFSDVLNSSVILIGGKLAGKEPDKKHPFGYGRIEYLSTLIIAIILIYAGATTLVESVKGIIFPQEPSYSLWALITLGLTIIAKFIIGTYTRAKGKTINSDALTASGGSAIKKGYFSIATLAIAIIYIKTGICLDAYLGIVLAGVLVYGGVKLLVATVSKLIGQRAPKGLARDIKKTIVSIPGVRGAYDLVLHNYGPDAMQASAHIEVLDTFQANHIDKIERQVVQAVEEKHNVFITGLSIYAANTKNDFSFEVQKELRQKALELGSIGLHGFYLDEETKYMSFDVVYDFDNKERRNKLEELHEYIKEHYPEYTVTIAMDLNFSD